MTILKINNQRSTGRMKTTLWHPKLMGYKIANLYKFLLNCYLLARSTQKIYLCKYLNVWLLGNRNNFPNLKRGNLPWETLNWIWMNPKMEEEIRTQPKARSICWSKNHSTNLGKNLQKNQPQLFWDSENYWPIKLIKS